MDELSSAAYRALRRMIEDGEFAMGERLREARLARKLNFSRTPIRTALNCLKHDGFLTYEANRGHIMATYTAAQVFEIYECRSILESEAVRMACERGPNAEQIAAIEQLVEDMDAVVEDSEMSGERKRKEFLIINKRFHDYIYAQCGNEHLLGLIARTSGLPLVIRNYFGFSNVALSKSQEDHRMIARALVNRHAERARALTREHIIAACEHMIGDSPSLGAAE